MGTPEPTSPILLLAPCAHSLIYSQKQSLFCSGHAQIVLGEWGREKTPTGAIVPPSEA